MQGTMHYLVMIVLAGFLITIALGELLYLNLSSSKQDNSRLQQTLDL